MTSYIYTGQAVAHDAHTCPVCGATMQVTLHAVGSTGAIPDHVDTLAAREAAMEAAISADARSVRKLVRCPSCRERSIFPVALAWLRVGLWFVAAPILPIIAPGPLEALWAIPLGLVFGGITQLVRERSRFRRADGALIVQLTAGSRRLAGRARRDQPARAALPEARATKVPSAARPPAGAAASSSSASSSSASSTPAAPPALAATPPPPRPEASAEPRFLGAAELGPGEPPP